MLENFAQWHTAYLSADLAELQPAAPPGLGEAQAGAFIQAEAQYYRFYQDLITDLHAHSQLYGVSEIPFDPLQVSEHSPDEEQAREAILKVRKVLVACVLDFLYRIGQAVEVEGEAVRIQRSQYNPLLMEKSKRSKSMAFLKAYERLGLTIEAGPESVRMTNERYPGMLPALSALAKECAKIKDHDAYFFRRCDFAVLQGKRLPAFEDALRLAPEALRSEVSETDRFLQSQKFKREIFCAEVGGGYRIRYQKKNVVYWCRVRTTFNPEFAQNVRWDLGSEQTLRLFAALDESAPGLSEKVFNGIKRCKGCYETCLARAVIVHAGQSVDVCTEAGWEGIGTRSEDFADVRTVLISFT